MKKLIIALGFIAFATSAHALTATVDYSTLQVPGFNPSKNVKLGYVSNSTALGVDGSAYGISAKHTQGNVVYGSTSGSTTIFKQDSAAGTELSTALIPSASSTSDVPSGWSAM